VTFVLPGALVLAFVITLIEMTEVAVLVLALGAEEESLRHAATGAIAGTAVVAVAALLVGSAVSAIPSEELLVASAVVLTGFGVFLFRSTLRTYRQVPARSIGGPLPSRRAPVVHFAGGFTVGVVEAVETVIVLIPLAAAGQATAALVGALSAGAVLVVAVLLTHERIRKIKTPWLKLGATALIFTYAVFWAGEALGLTWPLGDLFLIPLFVAGVIIVRGAIALMLRPPSRPAASAA
jgi:uncharacterized membrane protein